MESEENLERVVPVVEEELVTGTREVKTGTVRVRKEVERIPTKVEMPAVRDVVEVRHVPVNRVVPAIPQMREEGDMLIVPVVEEELVVEKRLVLKEEIHIRRRRIKGQISKTVTLEREHATVERLDGEGNVIATSKPAEKPASPQTEKLASPQNRPSPRFGRHKSLLD